MSNNTCQDDALAMFHTIGSSIFYQHFDIRMTLSFDWICRIGRWALSPVGEVMGKDGQISTQKNGNSVKLSFDQHKLNNRIALIPSTPYPTKLQSIMHGFFHLRTIKKKRSYNWFRSLRITSNHQINSVLKNIISYTQIQLNARTTHVSFNIQHMHCNILVETVTINLLCRTQNRMRGAALNHKSDIHCLWWKSSTITYNP